MNDWVDAEERIERAQRYCESKRWAEALEEVEKALEIHPHNASWWNSKAFLLDQLGRYAEAIDAYRSCLELDDTGKLFHRLAKILEIMTEGEWWFDRDALRNNIPD